MHIEKFGSIKKGNYKLKRKKKRLQGQEINKVNRRSFSKNIGGLFVLAVFVAFILAIIAVGAVSFDESVYSKHIIPRVRAEETKRDYKSMAVIETSSMRILSSYNETQKLPMASTTKIMTAILTLEHFDDLATKYEVPTEAVGIEGTSIYLRKGEKLTIEEYLYGLMLPSANDCAVALAIIISGSEEKFVELMNQKAVELGLSSTHFVTASGLHDKEHYTTSEDLAKLSAYAMKNERFRKIVGTEKIAITGTQETEPRHLKNKQKLMHDEELSALGIRVNGVKSGFTPEAGRCLVTSASYQGMEVIAVLLNAPNMFESTAEILKEVFNDYKLEEIVPSKNHITSIPVLSGKEKMVNLYSSERFLYPLTKEERAVIKIIYDYPSHLVAPITKDQKVGEIRIVLFDENLYSIPIYSIEEVGVEDIKSYITKIIENFIQ